MGRRERFLPDFRSVGCTFLMLLLGELFAFMFTLAVVSSPEAFWFELGLNSLFILCAVLVCQVILAIFARRLDRMTEAGAGLCVFLVVTLTSLLMTWLVNGFSADTSESLATERGSLPFRSLSNAALAGMAAAVGLRYQYVQYLLRQQAKAEGSARLEALQSRMKPHFLFNSLNSIASLIRRNPLLAEELTLDLAELFRAILRRDVRLTTIETEIGLSRQYLNIEQLRLGKRLRVIWSLDEDLMGALIPPLSLQPLIENAIHHGIEPSSDGGALEISCQPHKKNMIILSVRNSVPDNSEAAERLGNRIALKNLRLRLQSFFGEEGRLTSSMAEGFYLARIIIPYTTWRDHENPTGR
ncbi:two-component system, LytTR family, sensor histidine kinase AlgZ [Methylococcales bacterium]|nr:two-component system, LytTR family, sensor histidine kinase AlgZ [Methylococcales bacterium]